MRRAAAAAAFVAAVAASCASFYEGETLGVEIVAAGPAHSVPTEGGELTLFEFELTNRGDGPVHLERVVADTRDETLEDVRLVLRLVPRARVEPMGRLRVADGERTALLCRELGDAGRALGRDVVLRGTNANGFEVEVTLRGDAERATSEPRRLGPPLEGGGWLVANGPASFSGHRRAIVWIERRPRAAQRFAVDWFRVDERGATAKGPRAEDHYAFGARVVAAAGGVVAHAVDGHPDNHPGPAPREVEMSHATVAGNHVVVDLGGGAFAMYAHLRRGSVAVRTGDRVAAGDLLGEIGNSGNSTEPHLHFHVADGPSPVDADGLPWVLASYAVERGAPPGQREGLLPEDGSVVAFPPSPESKATRGAPKADETR